MRVDCGGGLFVEREPASSADDGSVLYRELLVGDGVARCEHCGALAFYDYSRRAALPGNIELQRIGPCCTILCALRRVRQQIAAHPGRR